ncbi:hypothetical protein D3C77_451640 [compost metagenome]
MRYSLCLQPINFPLYLNVQLEQHPVKQCLFCAILIVVEQFYRGLLVGYSHILLFHLFRNNAAEG